VSARDDAASAIAVLRDVRDEIEQALRSPGERVTISRKAGEVILDDAGVVERLIRTMAERS